MQQQKSKYEHEGVDVDDRTYDQYCTICDLKQLHNAMALTAAPLTASASQPIMRETMEVPFYTGSEHIRITVDKESFLHEMIKKMGLNPPLFNSTGR